MAAALHCCVWLQQILRGWGTDLVLWHVDADAALRGHSLGMKRVADLEAVLMLQLF
jgi:hypothetical protein